VTRVPELPVPYVLVTVDITAERRNDSMFREEIIATRVRFEVFTAVTMKNGVRFEVFTAVTMKNVVFWDMKTQFVLHRRHITSPLQSTAS
jgi:molybdenum cofactor biosynthesis enzyme